MTRTIVIGSRPSKLALWQTNHVMGALRAACPDNTYQIKTLVTEGDKVLDRPLPEIGGKGLFTAELEAELLAGQIDLAVHSLKDLPVDTQPGLHIGAVGKRADARDALISAKDFKLAELPQGAQLGTSSLRRSAQVLAIRPDLHVLPLRGNVDTRIRKALQGDYDAIILAAAGLERLELGKHITEYLPFTVMLPAPGQGALGIQCRADDSELIGLLNRIHDPATAQAVTAERAFLSALGAGCSAPVAAYAHTVDGLLQITGLVASADGKKVVIVVSEGPEPQALGEQLAALALSRGAKDLLK